MAWRSSTLAVSSSIRSLLRSILSSPFASVAGSFLLVCRASPSSHVLLDSRRFRDLQDLFCFLWIGFFWRISRDDTSFLLWVLFFWGGNHRVNWRSVLPSWLKFLPGVPFYSWTLVVNEGDPPPRVNPTDFLFAFSFRCLHLVGRGVYGDATSLCCEHPEILNPEWQTVKTWSLLEFQMLFGKEILP